MNPVHWYQSLKFKAFAASWLYLVCGWLTTCLTEDRWYWKGLLVSTILILGNIMKEWADPNIIGPINSLNKNNVKP